MAIIMYGKYYRYQTFDENESRLKCYLQKSIIATGTCSFATLSSSNKFIGTANLEL